MTSRISFSKMLKENLRHRTPMIIATIFIYLIQILFFVLSVQNEFIREYTSDELKTALEGLAKPEMGMLVPIMFIGVYLSFSGFSFLHSKQQMDLYGSLAVKRNKEFAAICLNSVLIMLIPAIIYTVAKMLILAAVGYLTGITAKYLIVGFVFSVIAFLAAFVTVTLAIIMTGHPLVAVLGCGVFASYFPLIVRYLIPAYASTFFRTYCDMGEWGHKFNYLSPVSLSYDLVEYYHVEQSGFINYLIGSILFIIIVGGISYVLYIRRPAEAAGRAMTFEKFNPILRFLLVIPMSLYAGLFLKEMSLNSSIVWLFVGIVVGVIVFHSIMECIYQFDIRGILCKKKQLGAIIVICFAFTGVFMADMFGYDKWIPNRDELASVNITMGGIGNITNVNAGMQADGITGEELDAAVDLIEEIIDYTKMHDETSDSSSIIMNVSYKLKNGTKKKRSYYLNRVEHAALVDKFYATEDYKNDLYTLYTADRSAITVIDWENGIEYDTLKFKEGEMDQFIDTYLEELTNMTFTDLNQMGACSALTINFKGSYYPNKYYSTAEGSETYYIYPSFTKTIALLDKMGITANPLDYKKITKLELWAYTQDGSEDKIYTTTNQEYINQFKDQFIITNFDGYNANYDENYSITVTVQGPNGNNELDIRVQTDVAENLLKLMQ